MSAGFYGVVLTDLVQGLIILTSSVILTLPFALIWLITMLLLPMQLVIKASPAFFCTLPVFLIGLTGIYFFWWRPLMKKELDLKQGESR